MSGLIPYKSVRSSNSGCKQMKRATHDCILSDSITSRAFLIFPSQSSAIALEALGGKVSLSFLATYSKTPVISSAVGAATRTRRHRDLIGAMSLDVELAQRMIRILAMYFSIVRRSAACASRERESASLMITTVVYSRMSTHEHTGEA
jgi:hypothetical protein